jgi:predicted O-methyltransferase YrrM
MSTAEAWHPGKLLELSGYYWKTCTLHAAVKLGVFSAIADRSVNATVLAAQCECAPGALERLLDALTAMGLLTKSAGGYANTEAARAFLCPDSEHYIGHMIMHHHHLVPSWAELDRAVRTGGPVRDRSSAGSHERRESFLMGMFNMAMQLAPRIVPLVDLNGRRHLLDLGGGPGTYAVHFCRAHPELRATVFDLPTSRPFAEQTFSRFGLTDRIEFLGGDYLADDPGRGYDAVWLSHILHAEGPDDCRRILAKAAAALEAGGTIIVHDFLLGKDMAGPLFPALFSLNMLLGTAAGQSYSVGQVSEMLKAAGVQDIRHVTFDSPNDSSLLVGRV